MDEEECEFVTSFETEEEEVAQPAALPQEDKLSREEETKRIHKIAVNLAKCSAATLRAELLANGQVAAGRRKDLVFSVAECRVLGALPPCLCCGAKMRYDSRLRQYACVEQYAGGDCTFTTKTVERLPWKKPHKCRF